jgi:hypothetical protein
MTKSTYATTLTITLPSADSRWGPSRNIDRNWPFRLSPDDRGSYHGQRRGSPRSAP